MGVADLEKKIAEQFGYVFKEMLQQNPPELKPETVLLETGLDSLGFTVLISALEDILGYDPFQIATEPYYPVTFGDFVDFYAKNSPAN